MPITLPANQPPVPFAPQVVAYKRAVAIQNAAITLFSYLVPSDGTYMISGCIRTISGTTYNFSLPITATDENGGPISKNIPLMVGGIVVVAVNTDAFQSYNGIPLHCRLKGGTTVSVATFGTFTSVVYNAEAIIMKISD